MNHPVKNIFELKAAKNNQIYLQIFFKCMTWIPVSVYLHAASERTDSHSSDAEM